MRVARRFGCALTLALCARGQVAAAQSKAPSDSVAVAKRISQTRAWVAATTRDLHGSRVVKRELSGFSSEGGEFVAYFKADTLRKLDARYYHEMGRGREEFYVRDGSLYFALITDGQYARPMTGKVVRTFFTRLYFDADRLIAWTDSTGQRRALDGLAAEGNARDALRSFRDLQRCAIPTASDQCEARADSARQ